MAEVIIGTDAVVVYGLSTDTKTLRPAGSLFIETDTGLEFSCDGAAWFSREQLAVDASGLAAMAVILREAFAQERNIGTSNQFGVGVDECNITHIDASQTDVAVSSGVPAMIFGIIMDSGQTGVVTVKDDTTTVSAPAIPSGASPSMDFKGAKCNTSLVVSTAASAACAILWRPI